MMADEEALPLGTETGVVMVAYNYLDFEVVAFANAVFPVQPTLPCEVNGEVWRLPGHECWKRTAATNLQHFVLDTGYPVALVFVDGLVCQAEDSLLVVDVGCSSACASAESG